MAIWIDELERAQPSGAARQPLRDRRVLRWSLEQRHETAEDVLLVVDALARPGLAHSPEQDAEAQALLRQELMTLPHEVHALRRGQLALLLPGPISNEQVKRLLDGINRRLQLAWRRSYVLVFGAARASETQQGGPGWLALADLRLQTRAEQLGLGQRLYVQSRGEERRRTGKR